MKCIMAVMIENQCTIYALNEGWVLQIQTNNNLYKHNERSLWLQSVTVWFVDRYSETAGELKRIAGDFKIRLFMVFRYLYVGCALS